MKEYSVITFPKEEIPVISKQDRIITTRVSSEYDKFHEGDIVQTPWNKLYKVTNRLEITDIKDHPYYNELTKDQISLLSKYDKIAILTLVIQEDSNEALAEKAIKNGYLYHGSPYKFTVLKPQPQKDVKGKAALSLSPFKSTASMFIVPFEQLKKGYKNCNWRISEWFKNPTDRYKVTKEVHIYHNIKELGTIEKDITGYLYTVKAEEALKDCSDNPRWTCDAEVLSYVPELHPVKTEEIKVHVVLEYNLEKCGVAYNASKESNEAFTANPPFSVVTVAFTYL
jgi:hypothetical protein